MEHETCNTLKNQGDNFEHTYGHGAQNLSVVCATRLLLAFVVDHTQQLGCALFRAVWATLGSKRLLWERRRALCSDDALASMRQLREALLYGLKKPKPIVAGDSSYSLHRFSCAPTPVHPAIPRGGGKATPQWREGSAFNKTAAHV